MRPLRLMIEGFGSYRERTELDLSDVDFFVLTGPTGSGKSTIIDALCFALYGTVPRWGRGNSIRNALAPSTTECRVCLVFEAAGGRYAAARQLRRNANGTVSTKEARLDRLDPAVSADADLTKILQASVEQVAEGPDPVSGGVTRLLGIGYEHFTQCVLLPQGRFAEFLQATPSARQDLLIELLAYAVYEEVGQLARERAKLAATELTLAEQRLAEAGTVTDDDLAAAQRRVADLAALAEPVTEAVDTMADLRTRWTTANQEATGVRAQAGALAELAMPVDVERLAARMTAAEGRIARCTKEAEAADAAETEAERAAAELPDLAALRRWRDHHAQHADLTAALATLGTQLDNAEAVEHKAHEATAEAEQATTDAATLLTTAEQAHRAIALAADLRPGEPCPVCRQPVADVPHHDVPTDLAEARAAVDRAGKAGGAARKAEAKAVKAAADARATVTATRRQLAEIAAKLADAPAPDDLDRAIAEREAADLALTNARSAARKARTELTGATRERSLFARAETEAWAQLRAGRDRFVALNAPAVDGTDLVTAWRTLLDWAATHRDTLAARVAELDAKEAALRTAGLDAAAALTGLLGTHGIDVSAAPAQASVELARHGERADRDLADLRARRDAVVARTADVARCRERREVADLLGSLLKSNGFERWLCAEALDSLVMEASETLLQLSGGQFELQRDDKSDLVVVDHADAGTRRPVNTLSGGETFQASLALALALSSQVVGLSGGRRDLNSMFLDEGFGTLDETTLDTVASTLERLAAAHNRMVGIVTHVSALADRVPVQFAVRRQGASSHIQRLGV